MKEKRRLSVLIALHSGSFSGVDTYAEQVAAAAATASHQVTLLGQGAELAAALAGGLGGPQIRVLATASPRSSMWGSAARQVPGLALMEMRGALETTLATLDERFDVAHLNHPALARAARRYANRVVVAAWFYPHHGRRRVMETWRHTGAVFPKSAGLALKGLAHYWNDRQGYSASDCIVAPTERLASHLQNLGLHARVCPPPGRRPKSASRGGWAKEQQAGGPLRIAICCGDLSHPRKNVAAGIQAVGRLGHAGMRVNLDLIGRKADAFEALFAKLPASVEVHSTGPLARERVDAWLRKADVLLVPSLYEEWGYVATEALLAGTPVVAFPVYPFSEVLTRPLGLCARDMSPGSLAMAIEEVLTTGTNRPVIASAAESRFGANEIGRRLTDIWLGDPPLSPEMPRTTARGMALRP